MNANKKNLYYSTGTIRGRYILFSLFCWLVSIFQSNAQITVTGGNPLSNGTYNSLYYAFYWVNYYDQSGNDVVITINDNTTESWSSILYEGEWNSLTIYPTIPGKKISGNINGALIQLDGANNVTIDGRVNQTGNADLTIENTNAGINTATIIFINSAKNNTIRYCKLKGCSSNLGIVYFNVSGGVGTTTGCSNTTIDHCDFTNAGIRPLACIYVGDHTGPKDTNIIISNNNFYNHHLTNGESYAIRLTAGCSNFKIIGNSFYETDTLMFLGTSTMSSILLGADNISTNSCINGNYFGGQLPQCGGPPLTFSYDATPVEISYNSITGKSQYNVNKIKEISNNIVQNIFIQKTTSIAPFKAINFTEGAPNLTITGNTIGTSTGNGSIRINSTANVNINSFGIICNSVKNICNNVIGSIECTLDNPNYAFSFTAMRVDASDYPDSIIIENNLIGSLTSPNSIICNNITAANQVMCAIWTIDNTKFIIRGNTISNLTQLGKGTGKCIGIFAEYGSAPCISNNLITNLKCNSVGTSSLVGIYSNDNLADTTYVSGNTITNLECISDSAAPLTICGIYHCGADGTCWAKINNNFISDFKINPNNNTNLITAIGINIDNGGDGLPTSIRDVYNNIITIGSGITNDCKIHGIYLNNTGERKNNIFFNTVSIEGVAINHTATNVAAIYVNVPFGFARSNIRNNIFCNYRTSIGANVNYYGAYIVGSNHDKLNYNDYYTPNVGGILGYYLGNINALPLITGQDTNSMIINPNFVTGFSPGDYNPVSPSPSIDGITIPGFNLDYFGINRLIPPQIGAIEKDIATQSEQIVVIDNNLEVYPNPFSDHIFVKHQNGNETYSIYNAFGQILWTGKNINNENFSCFEEGLYFITVNTNDSRQVFKILKQ